MHAPLAEFGLWWNENHQKQTVDWNPVTITIRYFAKGVSAKCLLIQPQKYGKPIQGSQAQTKL